MILTDRARSLVHWSDGQWSKIRMQEPTVKIRSRNISNGDQKGQNKRAEQGRQERQES
jgi:hypothetical protein